MAKHRSRRAGIVKSITKTTERALPVVDKGLTTIGNTAKDVAKVGVPVIEKGVSVVYGTMATGLDLGAKGVKSVAKGVSKRRRSRSRKISRSRKLSGGRRTRHSRRH